MNARGAGGLASAASQARVEMAHDVVVECHPPLRERLHQVDAPARRIHLGARQQVGRARLQAKPAMHAIEQEVVFDHVARRPAQRRRGGVAVSRHPPSNSPDEASGVENSRRVEGGLEPAHQLERAGWRLVEKIQLRPQRRRGREQPQMAVRGVRGDAPSGERLARLCRVKLAADEDLRDAAGRVRAKLGARGFRRIGQARPAPWRPARRSSTWRKFEIAQLLVGLDGARAVGERRRRQVPPKWPR